ncbi:MAG TPA: prolyl oligopeptidase family serine peptidase, partial [Xanthomonadales bacterium]|nr:prolyl oligopeptidase family serine peptidase [Xanthomonadales bacterium]
MRTYALLLAIAAAPAASAADLPAFQPMDVFALQWADRPQLSPDGTRIVYERTFFDLQKDTRRSNLWLIDADGKRRRPLTTGATRDGQAEWSPDGTRIAYVAVDGDKPQIHVRWIDSGATARVTQLTESPGGLAWSPDGELIAFTMHVAAKSEPLAKLPEAPKGAEWAEAAKYIDRLQYRFDGAGYLDPGYQQVFVVPADGGAPRQVTRKERDHDGPPAWLPDGSGVIVVSNYADDADHDPIERDLYRIDLASGEATRLTTRDGPETQPRISPDGRHVAYAGFEDRRQGYQNATLSVLDLRSGESRELTGALDTSIDDFRWDGNDALFVAYDDRGRGVLGRVTLDGRSERLDDEFGGTAMGRPYGGGSFSAARGRAAYTRGDALRAADVAVVSRGAKPRRLTDLNAGLLPYRRLGKVEAITTRSSADGREVEGWLVYPPYFDRSKKYPLLLEIHGGPFANYGPRFAPEIQLYAAAGYVVLYANPRGSTSYGAEFANAIHHAYPSQDYDDLMSMVDA